jgi:hypothetical protein
VKQLTGMRVSRQGYSRRGYCHRTFNKLSALQISTHQFQIAARRKLKTLKSFPKASAKGPDIEAFVKRTGLVAVMRPLRGTGVPPPAKNDASTKQNDDDNDAGEDTSDDDDDDNDNANVNGSGGAGADAGDAN